MAAYENQVDGLVLAEGVDSSSVLAKQKYQMVDYSKQVFGEAEYRLACKSIHVLLLAGKMTEKRARKLVAIAEMRLRVHRPAVSMEVTIASGQLSDKRLGSVKDKAIKNMGKRSDYKNSCVSGGFKTCIGRVKTKGKGRDLI